MLAFDLEKMVAAEIAWDQTVHVRDLRVVSSDGEVALFGCVDSLVQKVAAETAARRVLGVRSVRNDLLVTVRSAEGDVDDDLASMAFLTLRWDANVPESVTASVRRACVTLTGDVESQAQREAAETAIARLRGIREVQNRIRVKPAVPATGAGSAIRAALRRSAELAGREFSVEVCGDTVVLGGFAQTWAQAQAAVRAAWATRGVCRVENHINIV